MEWNNEDITWLVLILNAPVVLLLTIALLRGYAIYVYRQDRKHRSVDSDRNTRTTKHEEESE